jgi:hypothetical protein
MPNTLAGTDGARNVKASSVTREPVTQPGRPGLPLFAGEPGKGLSTTVQLLPSAEAKSTASFATKNCSCKETGESGRTRAIRRAREEVIKTSYVPEPLGVPGQAGR